MPIFCSTSIKPKAVPNCLGLTIIGKVGISTELKRANDIPIMETGTQRAHSDYLSDRLVSMKSINAKVRKKTKQVAMMR